MDMMELYAAPQPWVVLQQDGAQPHWELLVLQFLHAAFGKDGSPDIAPLDLLWGYVKDKEYSIPVPDIDTLKGCFSGGD
jgi:hypothetical protein